MIKSLFFMFTNLLLSETDIFSPRRQSSQVRLEKRNEKTTLEKFCDRIAPYVLFICIALLIILFLVILVKYGASITGTEANHYYNGNWR